MISNAFRIIGVARTLRDLSSLVNTEVILVAIPAILSEKGFSKFVDRCKDNAIFIDYISKIEGMKFNQGTLHPAVPCRIEKIHASVISDVTLAIDDRTFVIKMLPHEVSLCGNILAIHHLFHCHSLNIFFLEGCVYLSRATYKLFGCTLSAIDWGVSKLYE